MKSADTAAAPTIAAESPYQPEVMQLIERLDEYLIGLYPPESNHLLDIETLCQPDVRFFVARIDGEAVGCGALRLYEPGCGEIKRMFVSPRARGRRVGRALLERLEHEAVALGIRMLRLETGMHQAEAIGLYRKAGYTECEPFGDYRPDSLSLFLEKHFP